MGRTGTRARFTSDRSIGQRLAIAATLLALIVVVGSFGYYALFGFGLVDALYMTVITLSTVGFGEIGGDLSSGARLYTVGLIFCSIGTAGYSISTLAAFIVEGELTKIIRGRRMDKRIAEIREHMIICGGGPAAAAIVEEFLKTRTPFVLAEKDETKIERLKNLGDLLPLVGDPTENETLLLAGVERARGLLTAMDDDKDNVFVALTAHSLAPSLRIVAQAVEKENAVKLTNAGANEVVSTDAIGGMRMASVMIRPSVVTFLDKMLLMDDTLRLEEATVAGESPIAGNTIGEADLGAKTGTLLVALRPGGGDYQFNPAENTTLATGDTLVVMGTQNQLVQLREMAGGGATASGDVATAPAISSES